MWWDSRSPRRPRPRGSPTRPVTVPMVWPVQPGVDGSAGKPGAQSVTRAAPGAKTLYALLNARQLTRLGSTVESQPLPVNSGKGSRDVVYVCGAGVRVGGGDGCGKNRFGDQ